MSVVRKLLTEGRSVHETSEEGESLLSLACSAGYYELAQVSIFYSFVLFLYFHYTFCKFMCVNGLIILNYLLVFYLKYVHIIYWNKRGDLLKIDIFFLILLIIIFI